MVKGENFIRTFDPGPRSVIRQDNDPLKDEVRYSLFLNPFERETSTRLVVTVVVIVIVVLIRTSVQF